VHVDYTDACLAARPFNHCIPTTLLPAAAAAAAAADIPACAALVRPARRKKVAAAPLCTNFLMDLRLSDRHGRAPWRGKLAAAAAAFFFAAAAAAANAQFTPAAGRDKTQDSAVCVVSGGVNRVSRPSGKV